MNPPLADDRISSGIGDLDEILGGLFAGDNVVWVSREEDLGRGVAGRMLEARGDAPGVYVTAESSPEEITGAVGGDVVILDARAGRPLSEPARLEQMILAATRPGATRVVIDGFETFAQRWGRDKAIGFFKRVCPRLFDVGAIAYWRVSRGAVGSTGIDEIRKVTQCVFELNARHLRIVKAEGHSPLVRGRLFRVSNEDGTIRLHAEQALGRLAEGLRGLRNERTLSQADLARLAGVSSSAISQAEAGQRGLSLDTLLTLTTRVGIGLDELLDNEQRQDYVLARRNRGVELGDSRFLLDDPSAGLRVYLVNLAPNERKTPPVRHKGTELVLVARGLVLVDLGSSSPPVRAGDAILAPRAPIISWHNLSPEPSVLFWILRD